MGELDYCLYVVLSAYLGVFRCLENGTANQEEEESCTRNFVCRVLPG